MCCLQAQFTNCTEFVNLERTLCDFKFEVAMCDLTKSLPFQQAGRLALQQSYQSRLPGAFCFAL